MTDNPYTDLFADGPFAFIDDEDVMPNRGRGDDTDLPEHVRAFVDEVAAEAGREVSEYEVWHNDTRALAFIPDTFPKPLPNSTIDLGAPCVDDPYTGENQTPAPAWASEAWQHYDKSPSGIAAAIAAAKAVYIDGVGAPPRGNEHLPPIIPTIREAEERASAAAANARAMGAGWCAPTEAERWQWLTDDERAAEIAEARAAADRHGDDYIAVGGMTMPHPPPSVGLGDFVPVPVAADGMWDVPAVSVKFDPEAFQANMAETGAHIAALGSALAEVFDRVRDNLTPAFAKLGAVLSRITYVTPDGPPPPPIVDARTALIALNWAEWTQVRNHPDKRMRRHAKSRYLQVRRHLPREYRRRIESVPVNQFGALS